MDYFEALVKSSPDGHLSFLLDVLSILPQDDAGLQAYSDEQLKETLRGIGIKDSALAGCDHEDLTIGIQECHEVLEAEIKRRENGGARIPPQRSKPAAPSRDQRAVPRKTSQESPKSARSARGKAKKGKASKTEEPEEEYEVEAIVGHREVKGGVEYLVKFKGYSKPEYVPEENMAGSQSIIDNYLAQQTEVKEEEVEEKKSKSKARPGRTNTMAETAKDGKAALKKAAKKKKSLPRAGTMVMAATEGEAFLAKEAPDSKSTRSRPKAAELGRTRGTKRASSTPAKAPPAKKAKKEAAKPAEAPKSVERVKPEKSAKATKSPKKSPSPKAPKSPAKGKSKTPVKATKTPKAAITKPARTRGGKKK